MFADWSSGSYPVMPITSVKIFLPWDLPSLLDPQELDVNLSLLGQPSVMCYGPGKSTSEKRYVIISLINC